MKQLSDFDIENMVSDISEFKTCRQKIRIASQKHEPRHTIDLHGKTIEDAWQEILCAIYTNSEKTFRLRIISGRSGEIRQDLEKWLTTGSLSKFVIGFELENPGSFIVRFRHSETHEIIRTNAGKYKIIDNK